MNIELRGELWDNDSADILRWCGWRDITAPMDIAAALEKANGEDVTLLVNSPGGDMTVGNEIRSMLRLNKGATTALFQGYGASAATLAAAGCQIIQSEPGALLCYHNPAYTAAAGDYQDMAHYAEELQNARDCVIEVYTARPGCASREKLIELMDKNLYISPTQALEYGLINNIVALDGAEQNEDHAAFVAASGGRIRLTAAMRQKYLDHVAEERGISARKDTAERAMARMRALAKY